jgi:hypothetical protein
MRAALILAASPLLLAACQSNWEREGRSAQASGEGTTRNYDAKDFTRVEVAGPDDVEVRAGNAFSVTAEGDAKILDRLDIKVHDGTLSVGRKKQGGWNWGDGDGVKVHVTLPRLTGASVAGSGNLDADRAEGDFAGNVAGSGNLNVAALSGNSADLAIAGSGNLKVAGQAAKLSASIAGSGDIDARGLSSTSADVSIAGSGSVRGTVKGPATVSIIGSGDAELGGGASCKVSRMGSGDARCS